MSIVEDPAVYLTDFGVPVSFVGAPPGVLGIFELHTVHALDQGDRGTVLGNIQVLRVPSPVAALLTTNQAITINGVGYLVRDPEIVNDGLFTLVEVRTAP